MPAPQFIGPLMSDLFGQRGGRNIKTDEARRIVREGSPNVSGVGDEGAATERATRLERRVKEIDAMEARALAKKGQGVRSRGLSKKLSDERERSAQQAAALRSSIQKAQAKQARDARAAAKKKAKAAAAKKPGNKQAADKVAGATKKRAPRTEAQKAARNQREREARAAKRAAGA